MQDGWLETPFDLRGKRVWVTGADGMVGAALVKRLASEACEILTISKNELDLRNQAATKSWVAENKPDVIVIAAAKVGGILANDTYPADFLYDNLMIETNIIHGGHGAGVEKLLFLGSSCIYPKDALQPIGEDALLSGPLEPTNEAYAIAKIAGIQLCQAYRKQHGCDFISVMPCNLYGPGDTYDAQKSHVLPALIMKAHEAVQNSAEELSVWGSGVPLREFLHVDDLADALVFTLKHYSSPDILNIGSGEEISIRGLAEMIVEISGFAGRLGFDETKPDGTLRKFLDSQRIHDAGWRPQMLLKDGVHETYQAYLKSQ